MNISLIGMMGCGKTTIGKLLACYTGYSFIDIDELIVQQEGLSIPQIFEVKGEDYFRSVETQILESVLQKDNQIISTGGGIVKLEQNINILKDKSNVFYLMANVDVLYDRVKEDTNRPLLKSDNIKLKIETLLSERCSLYQRAHFIIDADKTPEYVVTQIIEKLK